jgi:trehalose synthase-fused probable maltokinase
LGVLHALVPNAIDGWEHALGQLAAYYAGVADDPIVQGRSLCPEGSLLEASRRPLSGQVRQKVGEYLDAARTLGEQTAQLHLTLARGTDSSLAPEPLTPADISRVVEGTGTRVRRAFAQLATKQRTLAPHAAARADALRAHQPDMFALLDRLGSMAIDATRIRVHQDYHLGQLLWTGDRFVLLDFEGEPLRPMAERRAKRSPLTDVAGMLRSYSYAAWSGLFTWSRAHGADATAREAWAVLWETAIGVLFLGTYLEATRGASFLPADDEQLGALLQLLMLDKGVYELEYELNNRPDWVLVPVEGLLRLMTDDG